MDHSRIVPILLAFEMHHFDFAIYISTNVYHVVDCNVLLVEMLANKADNKQKKQIIIIDIHIFIRKPTSLVASIPLGTKTIQFSRLQLQLKATEYIYIYILGGQVGIAQCIMHAMLSLQEINISRNNNLTSSSNLASTNLCMSRKPYKKELVWLMRREPLVSYAKLFDRFPCQRERDREKGVFSCCTRVGLLYYFIEFPDVLFSKLFCACLLSTTKTIIIPVPVPQQYAQNDYIRRSDSPSEQSMWNINFYQRIAFDTYLKRNETNKREIHQYTIWKYNRNMKYLGLTTLVIL